jgi:hypothetical protein
MKNQKMKISPISTPPPRYPVEQRFVRRRKLIHILLVTPLTSADPRMSLLDTDLVLGNLTKEDAGTLHSTEWFLVCPFVNQSFNRQPTGVALQFGIRPSEKKRAKVYTGGRCNLESCFTLSYKSFVLEILSPTSNLDTSD